MADSGSAERLTVERTERGWRLLAPDQVRPVATAGLQSEVLQVARRMLRRTGGEILIRSGPARGSKTLVVVPEDDRSRPLVRPRRGDPWNGRWEG
jgi:hypothetical protein